MIYYLKYKTW